MGIRSSNNRKNQLPIKGFAPVLVASPPTTAEMRPEAISLRFFTRHPTKPCEVDLTVFVDGEDAPRNKRGGIWSGPFKGRPALLRELLPAIHDKLMPLAEKSVTSYINALRSWWRLMDSVEASLPSMLPVTSTAHLTDVHRQGAFDKKITRIPFTEFLAIANPTRAAIGLNPLFWTPPEDPSPARYLPPQWQTDHLRHALKHHWFATLDRWALADALKTSDTAADTPEKQRLAKNYHHFDNTIQNTGKARPTLADLCQEFKSQSAFYEAGLSFTDMLRGNYPDGGDIRVAFHLCLATTGWNPAVLLSLDVTDKFIEAHPKDPARYVLRSTKARARGTEQLAEGLFKTQSGAGFVIQTLLARTAPLRVELYKKLNECKKQLDAMHLEVTDEAQKLRKQIISLEQGTRSAWLFANAGSIGIQWLDDENFASSRRGDGHLRFLKQFIADLNSKLPLDRQLAAINATDLRDVYAGQVYHASGGSILAVMKALGHRRVDTTADYLGNTLLKEEHRRLFSTFSEALWTEIVDSGRVDPTVLAKISRDGAATPEERRRLHEYRMLLTTRIGTKCKDPYNPPTHIAPNFHQDGKAMCHVQRCMLCWENSVVTAESMPGLCKRAAELRHLRSQMSMGAFQESSFLEELENTELVLLGFDQAKVEQLIAAWTAKISAGVHRVTEFDGIAFTPSP